MSSPIKIPQRVVKKDPNGIDKDEFRKAFIDKPCTLGEVRHCCTEQKYVRGGQYYVKWTGRDDVIYLPDDEPRPNFYRECSNPMCKFMNDWEDFICKKCSRRVSCESCREVLTRKMNWSRRLVYNNVVHL